MALQRRNYRSESPTLARPALIVILALSVAAGATEFAGGTGTADDPYQIATAEQLVSIGSDPNLLDKSFVLVSDIDLDPNLPRGRTFDDAVISPWTPPPSGAEWDPSKLFFRGLFDGSGHTIRNLTIDARPGQEKVGLFGEVFWDGCIRNLRLEEMRVRGGSGVGGLAGQCEGTLVTCCVTGSVQGDESVGLLAGLCHGLAQGCVAEGTVSGQTNVGGLIGYNTAEVTGCESRGRVQGKNFVGGLVGISRDHGRVVMCASGAAVAGTRSVGGLVGRNGGQIVYSFADAVVSGQNSVGGLTGENGFIRGDIGSSGTIAYCYALGQVSGREKVGGLVGSLGHGSRIEECYAATRSDGSVGVGGLDEAVRTSWETRVLRCFWDKEAGGGTAGYGGLGRTTFQMHDPNTFIDAGWDFPGSAGGPLDVWAMPAQGGYPVLAWQLGPWPVLPTFAGGTGAASDPFLIATAGQLNSIDDNLRLMNSHFALVEDIALGGESFRPIGSRLFPFAGTFDGRGKSVAGLVIRRDAGDDVGMFAVTNGGQIRNVVLVTPHVEAPTSENVGALAGSVSAELVTQCTVTDANVIGKTNVGGLVGSNSTVLSDCRVDGIVSGNSFVGGLVGDNAGAIERCDAVCTTSGDSAAGGLVGRNDWKIAASFSSGAVSGGFCVGGLVGLAGPSGRLDECFSTGAATGGQGVGGLIGQSLGAIALCYARTDVDGDVEVGGLVGRKLGGTVDQCYFAGSLSGQSRSGALIGSVRGDAGITSCFWDAALAGTMDGVANVEPDPPASFAKPTSELVVARTFLDAGWDFEEVWMICEGRDYPRLRWEGVVCDEED
ncbi:MAG: hypothetical protein JW955_24480 [Sedimentisphaerales bacterium]|nr:hypothetical protein [Sedimentisphaerales bacterium]